MMLPSMLRRTKTFMRRAESIIAFERGQPTTPAELYRLTIAAFDESIDADDREWIKAEAERICATAR